MGVAQAVVIAKNSYFTSEVGSTPTPALPTRGRVKKGSIHLIVGIRYWRSTGCGRRQPFANTHSRGETLTRTRQPNGTVLGSVERHRAKSRHRECSHGVEATKLSGIGKMRRGELPMALGELDVHCFHQMFHAITNGSIFSPPSQPQSSPPPS